MNYQIVFSFIKHWLFPPVFPDKEKTRAARWLNFITIALIFLIVVDSIGILLGLLDQQAIIPILTLNAIGFVISLIALILMRRGCTRISALILLNTSFVLITYTNVIVTQSARTFNVTGFFVLIPLAGLLAGRRTMNAFAALCLATTGAIFYFEWLGVLIPSLHSRSIFDDLVVLLFTIGLNTVLLNASIHRVEEQADETRKTANVLAKVNQELRLSEIQLQQAHVELEQKVQQRTQELQESNRKLQEEVEERQRLLNALATSEANWRSLSEQVPDVIARINPDYTIAFINRSISGHLPEELIGASLAIIHPQSQHQDLLCASSKKVFQTGETVSYEIEELSEDRPTWRVDRLGPIYQAGKIVALILISIDITEQKRTEAAMYQMQKLESLGVLAGGVAHDFNNLLAVMLMQLSLGATKVAPDHPIRHNLQRTIKAAERAAELTRQMLNFAGRASTETKLLDLNDLITDNIHLFSASIPKNVTLASELSDSIPLTQGDKGQLQQLIMNLIINGADAIGSNPGAISVVTKTQDLTGEAAAQGRWMGASLAAGLYVRIEVHDSGCGMDAQTLAKIFDPFFTTKFTGRGLGLASVIGIVRSHKGGLQVASVVGKGTSFTILLPAATEMTSTIEQVDPTPLFGTGELVLVIDDEEMVREGMADILHAAGLRVLTAADGVTSLHLFCEHRDEIRLVLLDLAMPSMNGEEIFHQLSALDAHVPVLLISGYSETDVMERFVNKGLAGFVQKPYTAETLLQHVQAHLHTTSTVQKQRASIAY